MEADIRPLREEFERSPDAKEAPKRPYHVVVHDEVGIPRVLEDKFQIIEDLNDALGITGAPATYYYAVFDGEGGRHCAEYARTHMHVHLTRSPHYAKNIKKALSDAFAAVDAGFVALAARDSYEGASCTATVLVIRDGKLTVAWAGDSSAVLCRRSRARVLTEPHQINNDAERERIVAAGGKVAWNGKWTVNGVNLADTYTLTRALGGVGAASKTLITPEAAVKSEHIDDEDYFVILSTRGLWEAMKPEQATQITNLWVRRAPLRPPPCLNYAARRGSLILCVLFIAACLPSSSPLSTSSSSSWFCRSCLFVCASTPVAGERHGSKCRRHLSCTRWRELAAALQVQHHVSHSVLLRKRAAESAPGARRLTASAHEGGAKAACGHGAGNEGSVFEVEGGEAITRQMRALCACCVVFVCGACMCARAEWGVDGTV